MLPAHHRPQTATREHIATQRTSESHPVNKSSVTIILALLLPASAFAEAGVTEIAPEEVADETLAQSDDDGETEATVEEDGEEGAEEVAEEGGDGLPISLSAGVRVSVPAGLLRPNLPNFEHSESVRAGFSFGVGYSIADKVDANLGFGVSQCLNQRCGGTQRSFIQNDVPDAAFEGDDPSELRNYETRISDFNLGFGYGPIYRIPRADISISSSLGFTIPVSKTSRRFTNLYTAVSPGLSFGFSRGNFSAGYSFSFTKNFNQYRVPVLNEARLNEDLDIFSRDGNAEQVSTTATALQYGYLTEWSLANSFNLSYGWFKGFRTSLGFTLAEGFTYRMSEGETAILENGDPLSPNQFDSANARSGSRGRSQTMVGSLSASYSFLDHYSTSLSVTTAQAPLTDDSRRVNFPFWDTNAANLQSTSVSLGFNWRY